jgi:four helix bundle protein
MGNTKINSFEDLKVWQDAMDIAVDVYELSSKGKLKTEFDVRSQITRSACSISNNIAEGFEYGNKPDFVKFLRYAKGSSGECRGQLLFLKRVKLISEEDYKVLNPRIIEVSKQLKGFIQYLKEFDNKKKQPQGNL